ncbi:MAG TPA: NAD(P)-dependent glycerol-3-phosphate dehydrogenase [Firmicutes bacterium]|nr:NAD(P)-dependent glycerol-3-phosphate dehydrogenase [Bacillota bacterium]
MRVSILGAGGWGTALSIILAERNQETVLWEYFPEYARILERKRMNAKFLKGIKIPRTIEITSNLKYAVEKSEMIVIAVPSHVIRGLLENIKKNDYKEKIFVSVSKGIEQKTLLTISGIIKEVLGAVKTAVLSGPSHAEEVARKVPTSVVVASKNKELALKVQDAFFTNSFRVYANDDVKGVELGGSLKNVIAIAAGVLDGMSAGDNVKAALITRGIAEVIRLGRAMGAKESTFYGLSGIGDLIVTCGSRHSRNRMVGEQLGKGMKIDEILGKMEMVAEGVKTTKSVYDLSKKYGVDMPISKEIYKVVYKNKEPFHSMRDLMTRSPKWERDLY